MIHKSMKLVCKVNGQNVCAQHYYGIGPHCNSTGYIQVRMHVLGIVADWKTLVYYQLTCYLQCAISNLVRNVIALDEDVPWITCSSASSCES